MKVSRNDYPAIIEVYNAEGKTAAFDLLRNQYGVKNPACLIQRIKKSEELFYDAEDDRFGIKSSKEETDLFMDLDELCGIKRKSSDYIEQTAERSQVMEEMVRTLISDRLLELSRYITLDPVGRKVMVDHASLKNDGYTLIMN